MMNVRGTTARSEQELAWRCIFPGAEHLFCYAISLTCTGGDLYNIESSIAVPYSMSLPIFAPWTWGVGTHYRGDEAYILDTNTAISNSTIYIKVYRIPFFFLPANKDCLPDVLYTRFFT